MKFFRKTGKLITHNEKLVMMLLSVSKKTYWEAYSNQDEWKINAFLKKQDVVVMEN